MTSFRHSINQTQILRFMWNLAEGASWYRMFNKGVIIKHDVNFCIPLWLFVAKQYVKEEHRIPFDHETKNKLLPEPSSIKNKPSTHRHTHHNIFC